MFSMKTRCNKILFRVLTSVLCQYLFFEFFLKINNIIKSSKKPYTYIFKYMLKHCFSLDLHDLHEKK